MITLLKQRKKVVFMIIGVLLLCGFFLFFVRQPSKELPQSYINSLPSIYPTPETLPIAKPDQIIYTATFSTANLPTNLREYALDPNVDTRLIEKNIVSLFSLPPAAETLQTERQNYRIYSSGDFLRSLTVKDGSRSFSYRHTLQAAAPLVSLPLSSFDEKAVGFIKQTGLVYEDAPLGVTRRYYVSSQGGHIEFSPTRGAYAGIEVSLLLDGIPLSPAPNTSTFTVWFDAQGDVVSFIGSLARYLTTGRVIDLVSIEDAIEALQNNQGMLVSEVPVATKNEDRLSDVFFVYKNTTITSLGLYYGISSSPVLVPTYTFHGITEDSTSQKGLSTTTILAAQKR